MASFEFEIRINKVYLKLYRMSYNVRNKVFIREYGQGVAMVKECWEQININTKFKMRVLLGNEMNNYKIKGEMKYER